MKKIFYPFIVLLGLLFVLSLYSNYTLIDKTRDTFSSDTTVAVKSFDPAMESIPGFTLLENKMEAAIIGGIAKDRSLKAWLIAANFSVTVLTALAALIASVKSMKPITDTRSTVWIAVITFSATLVNFGQTEITAAREENNKRTEKIRAIRNDMESLPVDELIKQISRYAREFNEL